jgi:hypothetical protein
MLGSSWVAAKLAASQEGLSSMSEWVSTDRMNHIQRTGKLFSWGISNQPTMRLHWRTLVPLTRSVSRNTSISESQCTDLRMSKYGASCSSNQIKDGRILFSWLISSYINTHLAFLSSIYPFVETAFLNSDFFRIPNAATGRKTRISTSITSFLTRSRPLICLQHYSRISDIMR